MKQLIKSTVFEILVFPVFGQNILQKVIYFCTALYVFTGLYLLHTKGNSQVSILYQT